MFINFWYPLAKASDVAEDPVKIAVLGMELVLFRNSKEEIQCVSNICVHRGASLGNGKVVDGCIECPYHGWRFDGNGNCVRIPSLGAEARVPGRAKVDAYPVLEKYGVIFAFLGELPEQERPPLMEIAEFEQEGWRLTTQIWDVPVNYERIIENGIDFSHNEFTHTTHIQTEEGAGHFVIHDVDLTETDLTTSFTMMMPGPGPQQKDIKRTSGNTGQGDVPITTGHHGPNCLFTYIRPTAEMRMRQYFYLMPIDSFNTRIFLLTNRNFLSEESFDEKMMARNKFIAEQDRTVLVNVWPRETPEKNSEELFVPADKPLARYRELLQGWKSAGWCIDIETLEATRHKKAYAIPGSQRHKKKSWVIAPVPVTSDD